MTTQTFATSSESLSMRSTQNDREQKSEHEKPPKSFPLWGWIATIAISFLAGKYLVFGHSAGHHKIDFNAISKGSIEEGGTTVTTGLIESRKVQRSVSAVGTLYGYEEVELSSKLEGRVLNIYHDQSAIVKPGDLLLELDPTDAKLAVEQAERGLQAELSKWGFADVPEPDAVIDNLPSVESARQRFELAVSRLNRMLPLQASNTISADDMEQARADARVMESDWKNQLLLANSAIATARLKSAELETARQRLQDCKIIVPTPTLSFKEDELFYTISERLVSEGTLLQPGTKVFRLVLGRSLKLRLTVAESNASRLSVGQEVLVSVAATPEPQTGTVTRISPSVDRNSRTFQVEVNLPNEEGYCKPGGFAKAEILIEGNDQATTVPLDAVYSLAGNNKIFIIDQGVSLERIVTLGIQGNDWIEIVEPELPVGASVATSAQRLLSNGVKVQLRQTEEPSE